MTDRGIIRLIIMTRGGNACTSRMAGEGRIKASPLCALVLVAMATFITWHLGKGEREKKRERGKMERDRRKKGKREGEKDRCLGEDVMEKGKQVEKRGKKNVSPSGNKSRNVQLKNEREREKNYVKRKDSDCYFLFYTTPAD